jgi:heat shock protein HtpX
MHNPRVNLQATISGNIWKTWVIMSLFVLFVTTIAFVFGKATGNGPSFAVIAIVLSTIMSIGSFYFSDKLVLATTGARPVSEEQAPDLYKIVHELTAQDHLPMPKIYLLNDSAINVIAHELSHVKNYDIRLMAIVSVLVGFVAIMGDMFLRSMWWGGARQNDDNRGNQGVFIVLGIAFAILSPIVATLIQLAISRKREFLADASGVLLTRYPEGLASALEKIQRDNHPVLSATNATAHLFIANPFKDKNSGVWFASLFNTHPPVEERIKILREM